MCVRRGVDPRLYLPACSGGGACQCMDRDMWNNSAPLNSGGEERSPPTADGLEIDLRAQKLLWDKQLTRRDSG